MQQAGQNCDTWASYESPGESPSATLCHGGNYEGTVYEPCSRLHECRAATMQNSSTPAYPSRTGNTGRQVLGSTIRNSLRAAAGASQPTNQGPPTRTTLPQVPHTRHIPPRNVSQQQFNKPQYYQLSGTQKIQADHAYQGQVQEPQHTAQVSHVPSVTSPIYMPDHNDGMGSRLAKNIFQGLTFSLGQQLSDYTRHVDMLGTTARQNIRKGPAT